MRNLLLILTIAMSSLSTAFGINPSRSIDVEDIEISRSGGSVVVNFTLHAGKKATKSDYNLVVKPVLRNGTNRVELPYIVIQGKKASKQLYAPVRSQKQATLYTSNGRSVTYGVTVSYEEWMQGSMLEFEGISVGCCSSKEVAIGLIAGNLFESRPQPIEQQVPSKYPFVSPISEYNNDMNRLYSGDKSNSISILFHQGKSNIDYYLYNNDYSLAEILASVREIERSGNRHVARVVIAGFASPEGSMQINERLGYERATVIKNFMLANTSIHPNIISIYNGAVDWMGLREMVAKSDMYDKQRIINIIDNTPVWSSSGNKGRHGELMRLSGGEPYRYMYRNFFPLLRQAAYIKIYYE